MELKRTDIVTLNKKLTMSPAIVILGPRQVGKTTLALQLTKAKEIDCLYLDLESPRDLAKLGEDAETFLDHHQNKLIILDEIQSQPQLFPILRSLIDKNRNNGRFLFMLCLQLIASISLHIIKLLEHRGKDMLLNKSTITSQSNCKYIFIVPIPELRLICY